MYNNPFGYGMGAGMAAPRAGLGGLFGNLFGREAGASAGMGAIRQGINWGNLLTNTQKTLGIINQAIPIFHQVGPIVNNAKTMFRIADAVRDTSTPTSNNNTVDNSVNETSENETYSQTKNGNRPIFYL